MRKDPLKAIRSQLRAARRLSSEPPVFPPLGNSWDESEVPLAIASRSRRAFSTTYPGRRHQGQLPTESSPIDLYY
ncbi:hypothetical protein PG990_013017 [Apiospora arundinis]